MRVEGGQRKAVAITLLAAVAAAGWFTMSAGRPRLVVLILLAGFALRVVLAGTGSRYDRASRNAEDAGDDT